MSTTISYCSTTNPTQSASSSSSVSPPLVSTIQQASAAPVPSYSAVAARSASKPSDATCVFLVLICLVSLTSASLVPRSLVY
ncbi:hypothetical protein G6F43_014426 [Rhizopus delemar]|nr:hypothetical protein G6F43_014426 [Rhizopus delemar]